MASHTPILSVGPLDGNAAQTLEDCERGPMYAYEDKDGIKTMIKSEFQHWASHQGLSRKEVSTQYTQYERKQLTKKYAELLTSI